VRQKIAIGGNITKTICSIIIFMLLSSFNIFSATPRKPVRHQRHQPKNVPANLPDSIPLSQKLPVGSEVVEDEIKLSGDSLQITPVDTVAVVNAPGLNAISDSTSAKADVRVVKMFNPDPVRAVWLSALFPGLGQIYNRKYWKLPILVAGYMALGYGTSWNNGMLRDYTRAYSDLMDNDPATRSYMDFFPPTTKEENLNKTWLTATMKNRKDFYRRNRDLCIIGMVGVYLVAMVDAYVDASLAHFDITPDLSLDWAPAVIPDSRNNLPGVGLQWALTF
jgi:hypothetical protein